MLRDERPPVGRDLADALHAGVHLEAVVGHEVVGPEQAKHPGEDDAVLEQAALSAGREARELHRAVHHTGRVAVDRGQKRARVDRLRSLQRPGERIALDPEERLKRRPVGLCDLRTEGFDERPTLNV